MTSFLVCGPTAYLKYVGDDYAGMSIAEQTSYRAYKGNLLAVVFYDLEPMFEQHMTKEEMVALDNALQAPLKRAVKETKGVIYEA